MPNVISSENFSKHNVDKYNFKVLSLGLNEESTEEDTFTKESNPGLRDSDIDSSALSNSSKESLIESLMKKTDEMSSNFIKLQMKLESMTEEHKQELEKIKEESFNEGIQTGKEEALKDEEKNLANGLEQFSASVATLENSASEYKKALEGIKSELITAALDIAKEVVNVELDDNSTKIAQILSNELIRELQSASKVTLKVNPKNHGEISQSVGSLEHIEIISDSAVSEGGVIAISDAGNIDSQISKRFERVKRAALSE
ncbi:flagellar assembly protein FliH [Sulfurimonas sp.]|uniref:flagellar assembly protein FliH n=1 Tax=Sulfurimonas sp. TaxID=2022749 RepID=UPI002B46BC40|nr:flagellar assembly protein FliH [Sulfurimonas sp.]